MRLRRWLRLLLFAGTAVVGLILVSPLGRYILRAGWEEAKILSRRRQIVDVIADPGTSAALRERLQLVVAARRYAVDSLGLDAGESFTTFAQLDRDTLVLVLSAVKTNAANLYSSSLVARSVFDRLSDRNAILVIAAVGTVLAIASGTSRGSMP